VVICISSLAFCIKDNNFYEPPYLGGRMAKFEGVRWAPNQLLHNLLTKERSFLSFDAKTYSISRSLHYGIFLVFEGIRFYCFQNTDGLHVRFVNLEHNLQRFRNGIVHGLGPDQTSSVPSTEELRQSFCQHFLGTPKMRSFLEEMASLNAQGYLRPYTLDEEQSIGVTFPAIPSIRVAACRYDQYLGEPFSGVVIPSLVRAVSTNGTGCLKLGTNYYISVKAVQRAQSLVSNAGAALFLDDRPDLPIEERHVTEWDSSCCLFALRDGRIIKIPEGPLILPSVTIQGIVALADREGLRVEERAIRYKELLSWVQKEELVAVCSIGTAGILNRCDDLHLCNANEEIIAVHHAQKNHDVYHKLKSLKERYWGMFVGTEEIPSHIPSMVYSLRG